MSEISAKKPNFLQALTSSSALLIAVWIVALVSIPSAQSYREQLASGTPANKIMTAYGGMNTSVQIMMILSWVLTSRWLRTLHNGATEINPTAMRLKRPWVFWSWIVPIVSLWFPKILIEDLLAAKGSEEAKSLIGKDTLTWWLSWIGFALVNNFGVVSALKAPAGYVPIRPELEIAGACILTASYLVWVRIIRALGDSG
jgi:hypothetical protein